MKWFSVCQVLSDISQSLKESHGVGQLRADTVNKGSTVSDHFGVRQVRPRGWSKCSPSCLCCSIIVVRTHRLYDWRPPSSATWVVKVLSVLPVLQYNSGAHPPSV